LQYNVLLIDVYYLSVGPVIFKIRLPSLQIKTSINCLLDLFFQAAGTNHPALFVQFFFAAKPHWIHSVPQPLLQEGMFECDFRFQHAKPLLKCVLIVTTSNEVLIRLARPLRAITPGQVTKRRMLTNHWQCCI